MKKSIFNKLWPKLFLASVAGISCTCGIMTALLLAETPFKLDKQLAAITHISDSFISTIPATLARPINVLILGIDNSGHEDSDNFTSAEALAGNSDTMLLVRLIPETHQINVLSIPRDTLVQMPNVTVAKINDANVQGGAQLAEQVVSNTLANMPIDRYVRIDTQGFARLVDALGEVEINIPRDMHYVDHSQKLNIDFKAGQQKLNGQHLEEYVRFRHDELGDIGRVQRQQAVLKALLQLVLQPATIVKLPQLLQVTKNNIDTDLSISEMLAIAQFLTGSSKQKMSMVMLPGRFSRKDEYPLSYWIKDSEKAAPILAQYFDVHQNTTSEKDVAAIANSPDDIKSIRIAVLNATGREEVAEKALTFFRNQGFDNVYLSDHEIDMANIPLAETQIIAQQGNLKESQTVKKLLGIGQVQVESTGDIWSELTVVVGTDLAARVEQMGARKIDN